MPFQSIGPDFIVNTTGAAGQLYPEAAALADGRILVTWTSFDSGDGSSSCIRARVLRSDGSPDPTVNGGNDFILNTTVANHQSISHVQTLADGRVVVTWASGDGADGSENCIRARIFNADLSPDLNVNGGNDFLVNTTGDGGQEHPVIASLANGGFVVTYSSQDLGDGSGACIRARVYNADGTPDLGVNGGNDFIVNSTTNTSQLSSTVSAVAGGGFIVAWESFDNGDGSSTCVRARVFGADGSPDPTINGGNDFIVNSTSQDLQGGASMAALADGRFVIAWESTDGGDGSDTCVRARVLNADGTVDATVNGGSDFIVNTATANYQGGASAAALADGRFIVTWQSFDGADGSFICTRARLYNIDGTPAGDDFIVHTTLASRQLYGSIVALADGRFMATWQSDDGGDGGDFGIRARLFDPTVFTGTAGQDVWQGGNLTDRITGEANDDTLSGLGGADVIDGGAGADTLTGGTGDDRFVYGAGFGADIITDFVAGAGTDDRIDLSAFTNLRTLGDVLVQARQQGADTVIDRGGGNTITLQNVAMSSLTVDDFVGLTAPADQGDFNSDGRADVIWRHDNGTVVAWLLNGAGSFASRALGTREAAWQIAETGADFNADGRSDVLWRHTDGTVEIWRPDALGGVTTHVLGSRDSLWRIAETGDFNGDDRGDILWRHQNGTVEAWLMNASGGFASAGLGTQTAGWHGVVTGDLNGDRRADIIWHHDDGTVQAWLMQAGGGFTAQTLGTRGTDWRLEGTGDLNVDGHLDLVWRHESGAVGLWLRDGGGGFTSSTLATPESYWHIEDIADFNADGRSDVIWRNIDDNRVAFWLLNAAGSFAGFVIPATPEATWHIQNDPTAMV